MHVYFITIEFRFLFVVLYTYLLFQLRCFLVNSVIGWKYHCRSPLPHLLLNIVTHGFVGFHLFFGHLLYCNTFCSTINQLTFTVRHTLE